MRASSGLSFGYRSQGCYMSTSQWSSNNSFSTQVSYIPSNEQAIFIPSIKNNSGYFAESLSLDNDGTRCVVGAYGITNGPNANNGATFVYLRNGSSWSLETIINPYDSGVNNNTGKSVAIDGSGSRIVIGSPRHTYSARYESGSVYVYARAGTWNLETKLSPVDITANDNIGTSVAITVAGDRIIAGAPGADPSGVSSAGAAYIFVRSGSSWSQEAKLVSPFLITNAYFGVSVAISGDGTRCIVGARYDKANGITGAGRAYVYVRSGSTWSYETPFQANAPTAGDGFGYAVAMDNTGTRVVIGSPNSTNGGVSYSGALYVFRREISPSTWYQEAVITANDKAAGDSLGYSISINNTGDKIATGAYAADPSSLSNAGKGYIFTRTGQSWSQGSMVTASDKSADSYFGWGAAISRDATKVAFGAYAASYSGYNGLGKAYIFT